MTGCHALTVLGKVCLGGAEYVCILKTLLAEDGQAVAPCIFGLFAAEPVFGDLGVDFQGHFEVHRAFHAGDDQGQCGLYLVVWGFKDEFVVDLEDHLCAVERRAGFGGGDVVVQVDHGDLDEIGGRALDDRVDRDALSQGAALGVAFFDVVDWPAAAHHGFDIAMGLGEADAFVEEAGDVGEFCFVVVDDGGGLGV